MVANGEDSFATRMKLLASAQRTIRIQALIFTGVEMTERSSDVWSITDRLTSLFA